MARAAETPPPSVGGEASGARGGGRNARTRQQPGTRQAVQGLHSMAPLLVLEARQQIDEMLRYRCFHNIGQEIPKEASEMDLDRLAQYSASFVRITLQTVWRRLRLHFQRALGASKAPVHAPQLSFAAAKAYNTRKPPVPG